MKTESIPILTIALLGVLLAGCGKKKTMEAPPLRLPVAEVSTGDVPVSMSFVGQTYGKADITIPARVNGFLRGIFFREGSFVRRGDLLYVIEPAPYAAQTAQSEAAVVRAEAELLDAQQNYDRVKPLAEVNAASRSDLDAATAQLSAAKASLAAAKAQLDYTKIEQSYTRVLSPVNGIIGRTLARVGDYVGEGSQYSTLNTVSQVDTIRVIVYIPEQAYLDMLRRNATGFGEISLTVSDNYAYPQKGRFDFIGRAVQQGTGSLDMQVSFPNPDTLLRPGQYARVSAVVDTLENAVLIPQRAVRQTQGVYSVYVLDSGNRAEQRIISPGNTYGNMWIVDSGLKPGEKIVTSGFHKIREGAVVEPLSGIDSLSKK